jgi:hypothetical protein
MGQPYIPHVIEHDTKDVIFFNLTGQRSSSPFNQYASVPSATEREGDLSGLTSQEGAPITIYDPLTGAPFPNNTIPTNRISPQATALLSYIPEPDPKLPGQFQNYQRITSSESNSTRVGGRFLHSFGPSTGGSPDGRHFTSFACVDQRTELRYPLEDLRSSCEVPCPSTSSLLAV